MKKANNTSFVFFGTPTLAVTVLDELEMAGYVPALIVTREDKPAGRKLVITPPPTKVWAEKRSIPVFQPQSLKSEDVVFEINKYRPKYAPKFDLFIVAAYGRIIPQALLDIPKLGSLNVHPSLLPRLRGPSPIESAILNEDHTGVSIMLLDAEMDHGPILAQEDITNFTIENKINWPPYTDVLENILAKQGAELLVKILPDYIAGNIKAITQDHDAATICRKIVKEDGLLDLSDTTTLGVETNLRKVRAYCVWPRAYFFKKDSFGQDQRIIVTRARKDIVDGKNIFVIEKIIPAGKKETDFSNYFQ